MTFHHFNHEIDPERTALVSIECQNEWLAPEGKLRAVIQDRPQFENAIKGALALLDIGRNAQMPVAHVGLRFSDGHPEMGTGGFGLRGAIKHFGTFPQDTTASEFASGFTPQEGEFVVSGRVGGPIPRSSNISSTSRKLRLKRQ